MKSEDLVDRFNFIVPMTPDYTVRKYMQRIYAGIEKLFFIEFKISLFFTTCHFCKKKLIVKMAELERRMNESIHYRTGISDALVGMFAPHPQTQENAITVQLAWSHTEEARDFCILEKIDCSSKTDEGNEGSESVDQLECPDSSKNKQCGTFEWDAYSFTKDQLERKYCIAWSTISRDSNIPREVAIHDRDSCGDYGATRLWFRRSDGDEMFKALIDEVSSSKNRQF